MNTPRERVLLVESSREISDLIAQQVLQPLGYRVETVPSAAAAIQEAAHFSPDLVIANLKLPGLSGKDLLVALSSQGMDIPIIVISDKSSGSDVIQAFRLGAADYLLWPAREAEVAAAVERALKTVRARRERESLARQLNQTNQELQRRVRELTTIFALGKAVLSITDQHSLFKKLTEGAVFIAEADCGWMLLREENSKSFLLSAQRGLPEATAAKLNQAWDDGLSSLVAVSGEQLSIHGDPIKRFKISRLGLAALVTPIKVKNTTVGLLTVLRKRAAPFSPNLQALMSTVSDYASMSIVNARLFKALEERARTLQQAVEQAQAGAQAKDEMLAKFRGELDTPLAAAQKTLTSLLVGEDARLNAVQKNLLRSIQDQLRRMNQVLDDREAKEG
ncbi:MAG: response regulator [Chloroflexi bacterium]|nr:response regulator [Chloroflexota bacterium]